jgi:hypothetical protein
MSFSKTARIEDGHGLQTHVLSISPEEVAHLLWGESALKRKATRSGDIRPSVPEAVYRTCVFVILQGLT